MKVYSVTFDVRMHKGTWKPVKATNPLSAIKKARRVNGMHWEYGAGLFGNGLVKKGHRAWEFHLQENG